MRVLLISANREQLPQPVVPLGLLWVAAALEGAHEVHLLDLCFEEDPLAVVDRTLREFSPEIIGIGIRNLHTNAYDGTERLLEEYKNLVARVKAGSHAPVVLGGAGFSLRPTRLLEALGADYGVVGEGEWAFRELVDRLSAGEKPPPLLYGGAARGSTPITLRRGRALGELDRLPMPARHLLDPRYGERDGTANVQTKRGCAFSCAYCDYPDLEGSKVRLRDPARVVDEVLGLTHDPAVSYLFFVDSVFNVPRSHALAICRGLHERGSTLPWVCYGSPVSFDEELVAAMAKAGCQGVEIGTDTGTEQSLERLRKPFGLKEVLRTRELFLAHGILDCHTFVLGALDETLDEVKETLDFVDRLSPDLAVFLVFMEDRETHDIRRARHRDAILELLAREAPPRPGWVVPELDIRFGPKLLRAIRRSGTRGPSWLRLALMRRGPIGDRAGTELPPFLGRLQAGGGWARMP
ncbi:MAG: cobalamin-dependent protein [Myxococcales bacterium]|nr:cobalamin-dependent protein [Polyangiaceae bacterium]MDW8249589.1 cobalamin-dependent protein [Myxococcales bacterium]